MARVEVSAVDRRGPGGGYLVRRVGRDVFCKRFILPGNPLVDGCDKWFFMLLRRGHSLNCGRPPCVCGWSEGKWLSRSLTEPRGRRTGVDVRALACVRILLDGATANTTLNT